MLKRPALAAILLFLAVWPGALAAADDPKTEKPPAEKGDDSPIFRWRVGAGIGLSNGTLITGPQFDGTLLDEGVLGEFSLSGRVTHRSSGLGASLRACWGCHGLELEEAALDWRPVSVFHLRAGRMPIAAGSFNERHDFNTRRTISKPLTRIMGNMVRGEQFNLGVMPAPYVDNALNTGLDFDFGAAGLSLDTFVMAGLKGSSLGNDIDFERSREFVDVNDEPGLGAALGLELPLLSLNFSYLWGNYDPDARRSYNIASVDARLRLGPVTIEAELAFRETEYNDPAARGGEGHFQKLGWWLMADWQIIGGLHLTAAADALYVTNIFVGDFGLTPNPTLAVTDQHNRIVRITGGVTYVTYGGLMFRVNAEFWDFSDFNDAWVIQGGIGWAF